MALLEGTLDKFGMRLEAIEQSLQTLVHRPGLPMTPRTPRTPGTPGTSQDADDESEDVERDILDINTYPLQNRHEFDAFNLEVGQDRTKIQHVVSTYIMRNLLQRYTSVMQLLVNIVTLYVVSCNKYVDLQFNYQVI